jgi:hypothetical protein
MTDEIKTILRRQRRNIYKQQDVVKALWKFAADLQFRPTHGCVVTTASGEDIGTKVSLDHVNKALTAIMHAFGYEITEEQ